VTCLARVGRVAGLNFDCGAAASDRGPVRAAGRYMGSRAPTDANRRVTHHLFAAPSLSMRAFTGEVEEVLGDLDEVPRRRAALLASELIAQVIGQAGAADGQPAGLTIHVREDAIHLQATGPVPPAVTVDRQAASADPLADWGSYLLETLADHWGVSGGASPGIWAQIDVPA
jgi:hypothetical protein